MLDGKTLVHVSEMVISGAMFLIGAGVIFWYGRRNAMKVVADEYKAMYEAKIESCETCRAEWTRTLSDIKAEMGRMKRNHDQVLELNSKLMEERDALKARVEHLEAKVLALEVELEERVKRGVR